jgi:hypothetical protein
MVKIGSFDIKKSKCCGAGLLWNKMIDRNARQNEEESKAKRKGAHKIFRGGVLFKSNLEQMENAYNNNETKNFIRIQ